MKYKAKVHVKTMNEFKFIGIAEANSIQILKEKARQKAILSNNHLSGRLYLECENTQRQFSINP
jgi:hypothetical protein